MVEPRIEYTGEVLSREEIWRRYPNEWVVLTDIVVENTNFEAGALYARSSDRASLRDIIRSLKRVAVFWTGEREPIILGPLLSVPQV
ncbi:MAG: hypothetical protein HY791_00305 [Deltaproteobacteria bacterium]|nr:hypothetical protein [Deltaproteobacteria bacterium]